MVSLRKRHLDNGEPAAETPPKPPASTAPVAPPKPPSTLEKLRNMWQFACLFQWLYIFSPVVKLGIMSIEDLETQCLSPQSPALQDIGLALLKFLSSHRGLSNDLFDEYTRRQFVSKAPEKPNPFGTDEVPAKFSDFDVFTKIKVLHQMTQFTMMNPEKLREKMAELKDVDHDNTSWRIEPFGWDSKDDTYFVLDDNRIYRLTELPVPPTKPKKNTKKARADARRASKRRRISTVSAATPDEAETELDETTEAVGQEQADEDLGGMKWECVAVTLDEMNQFLASIPGKKDANERILREKITEHLLPIIEQQEERRKKREKEREKELVNLEKLAHAKRSNRIASRHEQQKQEELQREEELKRRRELEAQRKEEAKQRKMERERDNRLMSRENRLREREQRRIQHEEELAQLSENGADGAAARLSERQRAAEIEKAKEALRELEQEKEEEWVFDCVCGLHGKVDDGQHSVSCERCNIWQHSRCLNINEEEAEKEDFHFVCGSCRRVQREAEAAKQQSTIKITLGRPATPARTPAPSSLSIMAPKPAPSAVAVGAVKASPNGVAGPPVEVPLTLNPPRSDPASAIPVKVDAVAAQQSPVAGAGKLGPDAAAEAAEAANGGHNPFSSPHPALSPPGQSPRKSHAYGTIYEQNSPTPRGATIHPPALLPRPVHGGGLGSVAAGEASPVRRQEPPPSPTKAAPPTPSGPGLAVDAQQQQTPVAVKTPRLQHPHGDARGARRDQPSSPLLPSHGGLSPRKQSPTGLREPSMRYPSSSPAPPIFPPIAALSPSAPKQDLTPPVKPGGLAHRQSLGGPASDILSSPTPRE